MKRIETIIPSNRLNLVVSAIEETGVTGVTILESKGRGKGARPSLHGSRGTSTHVAEFNSLATIIVIVDDSKVEKTINAILDIASTGTSGDGKIFVSNIEDIYDVQTKKKGLN